MSLSVRQREVMLAIQREVARNGHAPTLVAIAKSCGISSKGRIHGVISDLAAMGYLERDPHRARGLKVLKPVIDDRFEEAAREVCTRLGRTAPSDIAAAREAIFSALMKDAA